MYANTYAMVTLQFVLLWMLMAEPLCLRVRLDSVSGTEGKFEFRWPDWVNTGKCHKQNQSQFIIASYQYQYIHIYTIYSWKKKWIKLDKIRSRTNFTNIMGSCYPEPHWPSGASYSRLKKLAVRTQVKKNNVRNCTNIIELLFVVLLSVQVTQVTNLWCFVVYYIIISYMMLYCIVYYFIILYLQYILSCILLYCVL